jgi:uncharacterized membrane protein (DUF485 family)
MNRLAHGTPAILAPPRRSPAAWLAMAEDPEFRALVARKRRFLLASWLIVASSYFALALAAARFPEWFARPLLGEFNLGLALVLGEVLLVLLVASLYVRRANRHFDRSARALARRFLAGPDEPA